MNKYKKTSPLFLLRRAPSLWWAALLFLMSFPVFSALDETAIHKAVVRIEANGHFASGFLFGGENEVVTSLHAVLPPPNKIEIYCKGIPVEAEVVKFLKEADLVLLRAKSSLGKLGCKPYPHMQQNPTKPNVGDNLTAFGFRGDNRRSAFAKTIQKGSGSPETLEGMVPDTARKTVRDLGMPRADLPLYHISGALFPGLSGGPVFLVSSSELVGIVEGGLDAGVSNHAWLVPVGNLKTLAASPDNSVLPNINPSDYGYSSPSAHRTADNSIEYTDPDASYRWIKRKSRSFEQLLNSADASEGLDELLDDIYPELEEQAGWETVEAAMLNLRFDIYEETDHGLIIAVPAGSSLDVEQYDDDYHFLYVGSDKEDAGFTVDFGSHKILSVSDAEGITVLPSEGRYFAEALDEWMHIYCEDAQIPCYYDDASGTVVDFGNTRKLLRYAYHTKDSELESENYYSINMLVNGEKVMQVVSRTEFSESSAVQQCLNAQSAQSCGKPYWDQVSFLLAARLSSFTNLGVTTSETKLMELEYECSYCATDDD